MYYLRPLNPIASAVAPITLDTETERKIHNIFIHYTTLRNILIEVYDNKIRNELKKDAIYKKLKEEADNCENSNKKYEIFNKIMDRCHELNINKDEMRKIIKKYEKAVNKYLDPYMIEDVIDDVYVLCRMVAVGRYATLYYSLAATGTIRTLNNNDGMKYDLKKGELIHKGLDVKLKEVYFRKTIKNPTHTGLICYQDPNTFKFKYFVFIENKVDYGYEIVMLKKKK